VKVVSIEMGPRLVLRKNDWRVCIKNDIKNDITIIINNFLAFKDGSL
jgi:hypothetical protein